MNIILYATRNGLNTISNRKKETDVESVSFRKITDNLLFRIKRRSYAWHILLQSQMCLSQAAHCIHLWCIYHEEHQALGDPLRRQLIPSAVCLVHSILEHASYCYTSFTKNKTRGYPRVSLIQYHLQFLKAQAQRVAVTPQ